jgi:AraC-like DNA-binding protein
VQVPGHTEYLLNEPSILFFPRPLPHRFVPDQDNPPVLCCASIRIGNDASNPLASALPPIVLIKAGELGAAASIFDWLREEALGDAPGRVAVVNRLFELLIVRLLRQMIQEVRYSAGLFAALADRQLSRALAAVNAAPHLPWTVEKMANEAAMSRPRFAARFHEVMGNTPLEYVTNWRIGLAQQWLQQGKSLEWIASQIGYSSSSALTRVFRRQVGLSPRDWMTSVALQS